MLLEIIVGIICFYGFLYWLGGLLIPEFKPIEQELIKMERKK